MSSDKGDPFDSTDLNIHDLKLLKELADLSKPGDERNEDALAEIKEKATQRVLEKKTPSFFDVLATLRSDSQIPEIHRMIQGVLDEFDQWNQQSVRSLMDAYRGRFEEIRVALTQAMNRPAKMPFTDITSLLESTRGSGMRSLETPTDAKWSDLKIKFRDRETLTAKIGSVSEVLMYTEMGMADGRDKKPTTQWDLLYSFAESFGHLTWKNSGASRKNQKRREELAHNLKDFFRIDGDPIVYDRASKGWKTVFAVEA